MKTFEKVLRKNFGEQKGADVYVSDDNQTRVLSVWMDKIDPADSRVFVALDTEETLLSVSMFTVSLKMPELSFSEDLKYCYLKFGECEVHIKLDDEGVVVDVWDMSSEPEDVVESASLFYVDLFESEDAA